MRSRSPSRRTTPPPPRISRRSPGSFRQRGKSPDRRRRMPPPSGVPKYPPGSRSGSPPRSRDRREFGHSPRSEPPDFHLHRRSRSPLQREPKVRSSFSPEKRKISPKRERERMRQERERMRSREPVRERGPRPTVPPPRKRTRSKSPLPGPMPPYSGPSEISPAKSYQSLPGPYTQAGPSSDIDHPNRNVGSLSERFHGMSAPATFKKESDQPVFRGPEGTAFDPSDLKKITMVIKRVPANLEHLERSLINLEDVVLVRRPAVFQSCA